MPLPKSAQKSEPTRLTTREVAIIESRFINEVPTTLEALSQEFGVSKQAVQQMEVRAIRKLALMASSLPTEKEDK